MAEDIRTEEARRSKQESREREERDLLEAEEQEISGAFERQRKFQEALRELSKKLKETKR